MKITKDNVKLGQNLYRSTDGEACPIVEINEHERFMPVKVQTPEGSTWVHVDGSSFDDSCFFKFTPTSIETIIERLQSHDWTEDSEGKLRHVWAIVGGGE